MRIIKRLFPTGLFALVVAASAHSQDYRESFRSVTPTNFDSGGEVSRQFHLNAESYLTMSTIFAPLETKKLEVAPDPSIANTRISHKNGESSFAEYVAKDSLIDGVIVLQDGRITFESYPNMERHQRHFAWSVTKVVVATALASLADQDRLDMTAPIGKYLPFLAERGWVGVSVQNVADMASGIDCLDSDGYQDPTTCIYTLEETLGITAPTGRNPDLIDHLRSMTRKTTPGTRYEYVSANTVVLGLLIEALTQKQLSDALKELVWSPIGAEADGMMAISKTGYSYASGGLYARLRDVARFGQIYTRPDSSGVLSQETVQKIQHHGLAFSETDIAEQKEILGEDLPAHAGWQWDMIWPDGAMFKNGYSGQGIYVDPERNLVIAWFGTGQDFDEVTNEMLPISRQLSLALK